MEPPAAHELGERALFAWLAHLPAAPLTAFANDDERGDDAYIPAALPAQVRAALQQLPAPHVRAALQAVASRLAQARVVARAACVSRAARALATTVLPAPVRAARRAQLSALCRVTALACVANIACIAEVQAAVVALSAPDAVPPRPPADAPAAGADEAAQWHQLVATACVAVTGEPGIDTTLQIALLAAMEGMLAGGDATAHRERARQAWRASCLVAALKGEYAADELWDPDADLRRLIA
jgi:hypothetical protein